MQQAHCDSIVEYCEDVVFVRYFIEAAPEELATNPTTKKVSYNYPKDVCYD